MGQWAYLYAADQVTAFDFKNFVAVEQEQVVQLAQFTTEFARARIQRPSVSSEAVDVVLRGEVTLQQFTEHRRCLVLSLSIQHSTVSARQGRPKLSYRNYRNHGDSWEWEIECITFLHGEFN